MRPEEWIVSGDTGVSSKTIWSVMMGVKMVGTFGPDTPHDQSDFGRCFRLLKNFPEWKARLNEVGRKYPKWKGLTENWDELEKLYKKSLNSQKAREQLYVRLKELSGYKRMFPGSNGAWKYDPKDTEAKTKKR